MPNNKFIRYWSRRIYRRAIQIVGSRLYLNRDQSVQKSILIAGTARSGTTWLADIIASQVSSRILFEPFQSKLVPDFKGFNYFQYMRPNQENDALYAFAEKVLTGKIRHPWIDRENIRIFSKYRLIKEIRANLFLKWLHDRFPEVPILFILRHPCAVVLSRLQLGWATDTDIEPFLKQPDLISDFLQDKIEVIKHCKSDEEKHAVIWSISNLVPLNQFKESGIKTIYYENLVTHPDLELPAVFEYIQQPYNLSVISQMRVPSATTKRKSAVVTGEDKISHWKKSLTSDQIDRILNVVDAFGLSYLYGDSLLPMDTNE
jgi:hypothetical protein